MEEFKNHIDFKKGTRVMVNQKFYGQIIEVVSNNKFRVAFWRHRTQGRSEGLFTADELKSVIDFPPFIK